MIKKDMNPLDVVYEYRETEEIFRAYDPPGKCILCDHLFDSLESICSEHGLDLEKMLEELNAVIVLE